MGFNGSAATPLVYLAVLVLLLNPCYLLFCFLTNPGHAHSMFPTGNLSIGHGEGVPALLLAILAIAFFAITGVVAFASHSIGRRKSDSIRITVASGPQCQSLYNFRVSSREDGLVLDVSDLSGPSSPGFHSTRAGSIEMEHTHRDDDNESIEEVDMLPSQLPRSRQRNGSIA